MSKNVPAPVDYASLLAAYSGEPYARLLTGERALRHAARTLDLFQWVRRAGRTAGLDDAVTELIAGLNLSTEERASLHESLTSEPETGLYLLARRHLDHGASSVANATEDFGRALLLVAGGRRLTESQYRIVSALGVRFVTAKALDLSGVGDFELFDALFYEDDSWLGYLNLAAEPADDAPTDEAGVTHITMRPSVGRHPEQCLLNALRPEQVAFFGRFMPELLPRFRRE